MQKYFIFFLSFFLLTGCDFFEKKTTVTLFHYKNDIQNNLGLYIETFEKLNPKIKIETEYIPYVDPYFLMGRFEKKNAPDIVMLQPYNVLNEFASKGYLVDLSKEKWTDRIFPQALRSVTYNDRSYAFPFSLEGYGVFYNTSMFDDINETNPVTFSEVRKISDILTGKKITPFASAFKDSWTLGYFFNMVYSSTLDNDDDKIQNFIDKMNQGNGSFSNDKLDDMFKAIDFYKKYSGDSALNMGFNDALNSFLKKRSAMMVQNISFFSQIKSQNPDFDTGFMAFPFSENQEQARVYAGVETVFAVSTLSSKQKIKSAKKFLEYMTSDAGVTNAVEIMRIIPTVKNVNVGNLGRPYKDLYGYFSSGKTTMEAYRLWNVDAFEYSKQLMQDYYNGKIDKEMFLRLLDEKWKSSVKK